MGLLYSKNVVETGIDLDGTPPYRINNAGRIFILYYIKNEQFSWSCCVCSIQEENESLYAVRKSVSQYLNIEFYTFCMKAVKFSLCFCVTEATFSAFVFNRGRVNPTFLSQGS